MCLMDPQAGWLCQNATILLIGMQISSHKHSQAGWPGCRDECSKMLSCKLFLTTVKTMSTEQNCPGEWDDIFLYKHNLEKFILLTRLSH